MKYLLLFWLILFIIPGVNLVSSQVYAQSKEWTITLQPGQELPGVQLLEVRSDSLFIRGSAEESVISVNSVVRLEGYTSNMHIARSLMAGVVIGGGVGVLLGEYFDHQKENRSNIGQTSSSILPFALCGGALGGWIGYDLQTNGEGAGYRLDTLTLVQKDSLLQSLIVKDQNDLK